MAAEAEAAAAPRSNAGAYMKNAFFSMISITLATSAAKWLSGREDYIACGLHVNDNHWNGGLRYQSARIFNPKDTVHESRYVAMRDGVELAVDTYAAKYLWEKQQPVPAVVYYTRHGRDYTLDFPFNLFQATTSPRTRAYADRFVSSGYIWINVDVRGTGASAGAKSLDFSDQEVTDGYDLIDWIAQQPWCNGKVNAVGHGFEGVGALLLAASGHPALNAISLNGAPVDVFNAAFFPGGVQNKRAVDSFTSFTHDTDRQIRWREIPTFKPRLMLNYFGGNVAPVPQEANKLAEYVAQHMNNPNLTQELDNVHFRDDILPGVGVTVGELDAIRHLGRIAASGVAIHSFGGYFDMGVARSSILLHQYLTNTLDADTASLLPPLPASVTEEAMARHRLTLGPWSHAGVDNADPFAQSKQKCFWHLDEVSRFFDHHNYENRQGMAGIDGEENVHYFSMVQNRWKQTKAWPPSYVAEQVYYLGADASLDTVNAVAGVEHLDVAFNPEYDVLSRWDMISHVFGVRPFYYHERSPMADQFVTFTTPLLPLMELTGEVELRVFFSVDKPAVNLVAYLEDSDYAPPIKHENKRMGVTYMTEALLNPVHQTIRADSSVHSFLKKDSRELQPGVVYEAVLKFHPISYLIKPGHQLRLSIGVATPNDFAPAGPEQASMLTVHFGGDYPSSIKMPLHTGIYTENVVPKDDDAMMDKVLPGQGSAGKDDEEVVEVDEFADEEGDGKDEL